MELKGSFVHILSLFLVVSIQAQETAESHLPGCQTGCGGTIWARGRINQRGKIQLSIQVDSGDPFFESGASDIASVQINGHMYDDQKIKYDIYNQLMVLELYLQFGCTGKHCFQERMAGFRIDRESLFQDVPERRWIS